jgi:DNA invertase Pin-like site-specific DNA recombinase
MARKSPPTAVHSPIRVVGYVRVSTEDQRHGPSAQRDALASWCERHGAELVAVLDDLGVSGGAPLEDRPGLVESLSALESLSATVLLVAKRDRLARDPIVAAMVEAAAARVGARVVSAAGEGTEDPADPTSLLMRRIVDAFAEYERMLIRARTRAALGAKRGRGERTGEIPFGYRLADGGALEADAGEQRAIALVRDLRADGLSQRAIADRLNAECIPARGERWHKTTIARLLERGAA